MVQKINVPRITILCQCAIRYYPISMGDFRECLTHYTTNGLLQVGGCLTILLAVRLNLLINESLTNWLPLPLAPSFSNASSILNSGGNDDTTWNCGDSDWELMAAGDASIPISEWGVVARLSCGTISSAEGYLSDVSCLGWYSAGCAVCGQGTEEVLSNPQRRERNATTSRAKEEANLSIVSNVSMRRASSTYYIVGNFIYLYSLYGRIGIRGEWACTISVALSEVKNVEATNGTFKWGVLSGCFCACVLHQQFNVIINKLVISWIS